MKVGGIKMSIFNATYENLLDEGSVVLKDKDTLINYINTLENDELDYQITRRHCWWDNTVEFVIELLDYEKEKGK